MSSKKSDPADNGKNRPRSRERSQSRSRGRSRSGSREPRPRGRRSPSPLSSRNARIRQFQANRGLGVSVDSGSADIDRPRNFFPKIGIRPEFTSYSLSDLMKDSTSPSTLSDTYSPKPSNSGPATANFHGFFPSSWMKGHTALDARSQIDSVKPIRLEGPATAGPAFASSPAFASYPAFASSPAFASYGAFAGPAYAGHACAGGGGGPACWSPDLTLKRNWRPLGLSMADAETADLSNPRAARMQQSVMESVYADPFSGPNPVVVRDINLGDSDVYDDANASRISAPNLYYLPETPPPEGGRKRTKKYTKRKRQTRRKTFRKRK